MLKASLTIVQFSRDVRDATKDLDTVSKELQALAAVLDPLARGLSRCRNGTVSGALAQQVETTLGGCVLVVEQVEENVQKYKRDKTWTRAKWVVFGQEDMQRLRESLEAYKMALSLGLLAISMQGTPTCQIPSAADEHC